MSTRERKDRDLQQRRKLILDKSRELFFSRGFENVRIQDICDSVEYGRSALYALFKSKEEIYFAINMEGMELLGEYFRNAMTEGSDFGARFLRLTRAFVDFLFDHRTYYQAIFHFNKICCSAIQPEELLKRHREISAQAFRPVDALLRKGVEEGFLSADGCGQAFNLYKVTLMGLIDHFLSGTETTDRDRARALCAQHASIYLKGLKATQ
jgi:TetR/AcrR family transcriptional regulator